MRWYISALLSSGSLIAANVAKLPELLREASPKKPHWIYSGRDPANSRHDATWPSPESYVCVTGGVCYPRWQGDERFYGDGAMRMRSCDWIASVVLFVFAVLIILAFGFV